jgi:hypothetical protein
MRGFLFWLIYFTSVIVSAGLLCVKNLFNISQTYGPPRPRPKCKRRKK